MYSNENKDRFPYLDDRSGRFMFDSDTLYPEYLSDAAILACPSDPEADARPLSYVYVGYMMMSDGEMLAGFASYTWMDETLPISDTATNSWRDAGTNLSSFGFTGSGNASGSILNRLSAGVDRFLITDINTIFTGDEVGSSVVPVMWDQISTNISEFSHVPAGQNVLYLDGHVDFHRYDLTSVAFPVSPMYAAVNGGVEERARTMCP
jgi:prepilin-type processing-associated H-X9-DG protein